MSWEEEIRELHARQQLAHEMGGPEKVARQHEFNKLTIRERIAAIGDAGSFMKSARWPALASMTTRVN